MVYYDLSIDDFCIFCGFDGKIIIDYMKVGLNKRLWVDDEKDNLRSKKKCKVWVVVIDGSEWDFVCVFEVYLCYCLFGILLFYFIFKYKFKGDIWFNKVLMGKNFIGRIMREIKVIVGIG